MLVDWIQVVIRARVEEEVGSCPSCRIRRVIIIDSMGVKELAGVICIVTSFFQPYR